MNALHSPAIDEENLIMVRTEFWQGVRDSLPLVLGAVPFGLTCGVMGLTAGLTGGETVLMSLTVFAGAAQFISITMFGAGVTGWGLYIFTTLLVNLRHLLMGASLAPHMKNLPLAWQAVLTFGMTDETYAVTMNRTMRSGYHPSYQLGANLALYFAWAMSTAVGVAAGSMIPNPLAWGLDFAMPATFLAMLLPRIKERRGLLVCLTAALVAVMSALWLPGKWYIITAAVAATVVGGLLEGAENSAA